MVATAGHSQAIPWRKLHLDLRANNEPLDAFLGRVLTFSGIPATMSSPIAGARVNGRLQGTGESIFRELADTYGLTWYHNGSMLYVYSLAEMESRMLRVAPADVPRVERALREMRLLDTRFALKVSASEGQLLVSGPPQYVQMVSDVATGVAHSPSQNPHQVDIRVFRLRHARAADTVVSIAGTETTIPGVARILNETLGSARFDINPLSRTLPVAMTGLRGKGQISIGRGDVGRSSIGRGDVGRSSMGRGDVGANNEDGSRPDSGSGGALIAPVTNSVKAPPASAMSSSVGGLEQQSSDADTDATLLNTRPGAQAKSSRDGMSGTANPLLQRALSDGIVRADPRINAVIIRDTQDRMALYARLIGELDVTMPLLEIEATVIDVSREKSDQLGIDWRLHAQRADIISSPNGLADGSGGASDLKYGLPAVASGSAGLVGTLLFGSERTNFLARVNALALNGDANLVSKPRVLTLDNTEAVLQSTQDFYVRVAGRDQVDLFNVSLGLVLRVTPTLIEGPEGNSVKLTIRIEDGNTNNGTQVDQIPVVNRNAISTQAVVADGHSLLIGGYTVDESSRSASGIPVLSDIPGLRWLFGQKSSSSRRVERIFMLTPRLVRPEESQNGALVSMPPVILPGSPPLPDSARALSPL